MSIADRVQLSMAEIILWRGVTKISREGAHRPRSEIKYQQKNHWGEVLNFFLSEDHKTTLTFCQVIILLYTI